MGKFIVFEGIDGSGKSTLSKKLFERLKEQGYKVIWTKEPYNNITKTFVNDVKDWKDKVLFFALDRMYHLMDLKKWKSEYDFIICDRYLDSSLVYQHILSNKEVSQDYIKDANNLALDFEADMTFYLDISIESALKRLNLRSENDELDFILNKDNLAKIKDEYWKLYENDENTVFIDENNQNVEYLFEKLKERFR